MTLSRREGTLLVVAGAVAFLVPLVLSTIVESRRITRVEPALSRALGEEVHLGDVELELLGTLRLEDVAIGARVRAASVEASVGLGTLLHGAFAADEIRVERPRVRARLDPDGTVDLAALVARVRDARSHARGPTTAAPRRSLRRVLVTGGELVVSLEGYGEVRARGVELHPHEGGVRVVTGPLVFDLTAATLRLAATFARGGLDVTLPGLHVGRAALDGGHAALRAGDDPPLELEELVVARGLAGAREETRLEGRLAGSHEAVKVRVAREHGGTELEVKAASLPLASFGDALPAWLDTHGARAGGRLTLRADAGGELWLSLAVDLAGTRLEHDVLASAPLPLDGHLTLEGSWDRAGRAGSATVRLESGALVLSGQADVAFAPGGAIQRMAATAELPATPCAGALSAIPRPLRARVDGLELDGTIAGRAQLAFDVASPEDALLDVDLDVRCRVLADPPAADVARVNGPYRHTLPNGQPRVLGDADEDFVPLARVPKHVLGAFVAGEDSRFFEHGGFDEVELRRSFAIDVAARRIERGGSTISQQLVKNLWLGRERTLGRKLLEAILTWRLEQKVGKRRILEAYLNVIELGDGVYGLEPAALRWFGKKPRELTVAEAAFLAALTPAPVSTDHRLRAAGRIDARTLERVHAVLRAMRRAHVIDDATFEAAREERLKLRI